MNDAHDTWLIKARTITLDRPRLMGILNVTPDSFSDGGKFLDPDAALGHAVRMIEEGASIIDIGGESTRPGAEPVEIGEQISRIVPVIERIRSVADIPISVDTTRADVARAAIDAGANIINDVAAGVDDPGILTLAAQTQCGLILMHRRTRPQDDSYSTDYEHPPLYEDVVESVAQFLRERIDAAMCAGVLQGAIVGDPGLGFGKSVDQNYELMARFDEFRSLGVPMLAAASRKSFVSAVAGDVREADRQVGSIAAAMAMHDRGARLFRVHDVALHRSALDVWHRLRSAQATVG